jgi:hypothetical protein
VDHRIELADGWSLWRWVWVRAAGFPVNHVLELAAPAAALAADQTCDAERAVAAAREAAITELRAAKVPGRAIQKLDRGRWSTETTALVPTMESLRVLRDREAELARCRDRFAQAYAAAGIANRDALRSVAGESRLREALLWQNRAAVHGGIDWLLAHPELATSEARKIERSLASYLQRYCTKNDTIGFFGPIAWGELRPAARAIEVRPGPQLLDKRTVYFEYWAIDALARVLAADPALRPAMRPRRTPTVRLDAETVHYPVARHAELPPEYARLLAACDGTRTARAIAVDLVADPDLAIDSEAEVYSLLDDLVAKHFCTWTFEVPTVTEWPERHLAAQLAEVADPAARARALGILDTLASKRAAVAAAAGDPVQLDLALGALARTFEQLTGQSSTRHEGKMYAGRTLVFEDCRRDLQVELGADFLAQLAPPLLVMLRCARWYTFRLAELYRAALVRAFHAAAAGAPSVDYLTYWQHAKELFPERGSSPIVDQVTGELQRAWSRIAGLDPAARRLELASSAIGAAIADVFAAPHAGWPGARYHSPDVMIGASSVDAIRAGRGVIVLGEFHPSTCTIHFAAQKEHADRAALVRARELDLPEAIPSPVIAKEHASRADHMWVSQQDVDVELGATRSWRPRDHVLAVGELVLEYAGDRLCVRDRDGRRSFEVLEFFGAFLTALINTRFDIFPAHPHMPRISIDGVVVVRETWRFAPATLAFATLDRGAEQFAAARLWAREHDLPRWVFVKVPEETKPTYVDLESPVYVEIFAKQVRAASVVVVSEMLPAPPDTWLPDAEGRTYTSELRLVAVDPLRWAPP